MEQWAFFIYVVGVIQQSYFVIWGAGLHRSGIIFHDYASDIYTY